MVEIKSRGESVTIPTEVSELSPDQYRYFCFLGYSLGGGVIDIDYFKVRWLSYLAGLGKTDFTILKGEWSKELARQLDAIDGFFKASSVGGEDHLTPDFHSTKNLLPEYEGYKGPGDWLEGQTFGEFVECLTIIESLADAADEEISEGYKRIARIIYHIPETDAVPELLAFHAPTFFISIWKEIQDGPIEINGHKVDFRIIFKSYGLRSKPDDKTGWTGITFEIATARLFGNVKEVEAADFWAVLMYLYKCKFEYIHDKSNAKK